MKRTACFILITFYFLGCNLISPPNGETTVSGKIIDESTGAAVDNISIVLVETSGNGSLFSVGGYKTVAQTNTNNDGTFNLYYDAGDDRTPLTFYLNKEPYNKLYSTKQFNISPGSQIKNKAYTIYQNTRLKVTINSKTYLEPGTYTLWLPGIGTSIDTILTTKRAKGNFYNTVKLNYTIGSLSYEIIDSVYCPINEETNFTLDF